MIYSSIKGLPLIICHTVSGMSQYELKLRGDSDIYIIEKKIMREREYVESRVFLLRESVHVLERHSVTAPAKEVSWR